MARLRRAALQALGAGTLAMTAACSAEAPTPVYGGPPVDASADQAAPHYGGPPPQDAMADDAQQAVALYGGPPPEQDAAPDAPQIVPLYGAAPVHEPLNRSIDSGSK
jgi:hypothetical protein